MLGKMEIRTPPGSRPRDGKHCDLCGCSQPAVRCDKCGCQIFCLSCDDMYHRHPKRRFHLRKAVDPLPPAHQARPVLPVKLAHLTTASAGDPSKMPLPPPRKKKSLFGSFRKPSPTSDNSPPLPKKEYSWTDRLGSIKKFMSNRPLPPLPNPDDNDMESPTTNGQPTRGDLTFIHRRSDERPPQLPQRSPKSPDFPGINQDNRFPSLPGHQSGQIRNGLLEPNANHMNQNREFINNEENQWNNMMNNQNGPQKFGTLNRQSHQRGFMPPGAPGYPGGMHQSSSATDLHNLQNVDGMQGTGQVPPHYPHYPMNPMNPHMPPHYPYPMYPQYPNYPQYFGNSFANLSNPPTSEGDVSDQSESTSRHSSKRHPFRKRAKRSQSVMMDRMAYPGQFYPFGPFPGYGPWGAPMPMEAPPSPASSVRSLNRTGRTRRRKKLTSEDDDEEFSVSSSPLSRPKSSSSDPKDQPRAPLATQTTSSEDESEGDLDKRRHKHNTIQRRQSEPLRTMSPAIESKMIARLKKSSSKQSDSETQSPIPDVQGERKASMDSSTEQPVQQQLSASSASSDIWECKHCTFANPAANKICQVCCKTATPRTETPVTAQSRPTSAATSSGKLSADSEKCSSSPEKQYPENEEERGRNEKQDMASLNSALDEAEKQISKGLEELMKLKDDIDANISKEKNKTAENQPKSETEESSKPVYKSSGRMRTSILDKLNLNKPQTSNTSVSTSTETQSGQGNWTSDKIIEARRHSNSSTPSETYNSPMAQSPELERGFLGNKQKRDSSCQTQQDSIAEYLERKKASEEAFLGRPVNNFGFGYGDRMDMVTSPVPSMYDRFFGGGYGMMQRSHSRASLFSGRMNDPGPMDYGGGPGFGYGPAPMYRSVSRGSLTGDYPDGRMSEFHNLRKPDFYLSMEELVERRRQDNIRAQGLELVRMIREAEQQGFNADDIQVALTHCGKQNPMEWLQENWRNMVDSVVTLSTNYGNDKKENDIGLLGENEARDALRLHKGNIWAAVTECVEGRQRKYLELSARGSFSKNDIVDALTSSEGDVEMAYAKLSKSTGKPFLMRIWGAGEGVQNQDGARPIPEDFNDAPHRYLKDETLNSDELSEEIWSEDGDEVEWEDDEEYGEERGEFEDLQTCHEDLHAYPQEMRTPESDKSDYCDAYPVDDRNVSSPSDDIFYVIPEAKPEKKKGFLSKLAALRKDSKEQVDTVSNIGKDQIAPEQNVQSKEDAISQNSTSSSEQPKNNGAFNALKNTLSAIKDTVTGGTKNDKKVPCAQPERRTIIVRGEIDHESLNDSKDKVKLTSIKPLEVDILPMSLPEKEPEETSKLINESTNKGAIKRDEDIKTRTLMSDPKQSNQLQSDKDAENQVEPKNKVENKKPQSLAERLKFAKQTRSTTKASSSYAVQKEENSLPDASVKDTVNSDIHKGQLSANKENITYRNADGKGGSKLEVDSINQIPKDAHLTIEKEKKLENVSPDITQSTASLTQQNINKERKLQREDLPSSPVGSIQKSPTTTTPQNIYNEPKMIGKSIPPESETPRTAKGYSGDVKLVNQVKQVEQSAKSKTEEISHKKVVPEKILENVSTKVELSHPEKHLESSSSTNAVRELDKYSTTPKSEIVRSDSKITDSTANSGTPKDIYSSSVNKNSSETEASINDSEIHEITKKTDQIPATTSIAKNVTADSDKKEEKVNAALDEAVPNVSSETEKSIKEIRKTSVKDSKFKSDIPQSKIPTTSENLNDSLQEASASQYFEAKSENSVNSSIKEENKNQKQMTIVDENQEVNSRVDVSENADLSKNSSFEETSSSSKILIADSSEKIVIEESENHNSRVVPSKTENIIKEIEITKKAQQESNFEDTSTDKPQSNIPKTEIESSQIVSMNQLNEKIQNSPITSSVQTIAEEMLEKSSPDNYNIQPLSIDVALEVPKVTPEKSPEVEILTHANTDQNGVDTAQKNIASSNRAESLQTLDQGNEVTQIRDVDVKSTQNLEAISDSSQDTAHTNLSKDTTVIPSANEKDTPYTSEGTKIVGKFKFSKSGKVKKTQIKDEKESQNKIADKNQPKAQTSTISPALTKSTSIAAEEDCKPSTSYDDSNSKSDVAFSHIATNESDGNKPLSGKESSEKAMENENPDNKLSEIETKTLQSENDVTTIEERKVQSAGSENNASALEISSDISSESKPNTAVPTESQNSIPLGDAIIASASQSNLKTDTMKETPSTSETEQKATSSKDTSQNSANEKAKTVSQEVVSKEPVISLQEPVSSLQEPVVSKEPVTSLQEPVASLQEPVVSKEFPGSKSSVTSDVPASPNTSVPDNSDLTTASSSGVSKPLKGNKEIIEDSNSSEQIEQHSKVQDTIITDIPTSESKKISSPASSSVFPQNTSEKRTASEDDSTSQTADFDDSDIQYSDESRPSSVTPPSPVDALRSRFEGLAGGGSVRGGPIRPQSPFRRMSFNSRKQVIALERKRETTEKPWFRPKIVTEPVKTTYPKRSIKQQLEMERRVRKMVSDRKCRTYRKAEIVVQLMDMHFDEDEAILAANECSTLELAMSYLQQECLLCTGHFPVAQIVSMTHCEHKACRECIRAYFTVQIRDRTILDLLCPFCNEPDIGDEDVAQDYFNHLDIMLKKLVDTEIHELFQRKLRDRVLMKDPNFRWCSQCSSGFIAMPNLKRLVCPDCNAVTCASCRRIWERDHQGISCEAFAALKETSETEVQAAGLAKMLTEDGIDCPRCHFRYALAKGGCMHFRCIQCQHDFCSGCSRPFRMGQKCGVSEFCGKLGLHAHHPRNCLFYLRDKEPEDLQKLLDLNDVEYNRETPDDMEMKRTCQVMEQKETPDGMIDDHCGKEIQDGYAGLCRVHYVEYLGQLVNKHKVDPIQIFDNDDLELVLRRANIRLPPKRYRENDIQYREKLVNLIQEELPLDKMDGS